MTLIFLDLHLDRRLVDKRVSPAVDVNRSGARKEENLMRPDEADRVRAPHAGPHAYRRGKSTARQPHEEN